MRQTVRTLSGRALVVSIADQPCPATWEELTRLADRMYSTSLTALYRGKLCPLYHGFLAKNQTFCKIRPDAGPTWIDAPRDILDGVYCMPFEVQVSGSWYEADKACAEECLIRDPGNRTGLHTMNDSYMWGSETTAVPRKLIAGIRVYRSENLLDAFFDLGGTGS